MNFPGIFFAALYLAAMIAKPPENSDIDITNKSKGLFVDDNKCYLPMATVLCR